MLYRVVTDADVVVYETRSVTKAKAVEMIWQMAHACRPSEPNAFAVEVIDGREVPLA